MVQSFLRSGTARRCDPFSHPSLTPDPALTWPKAELEIAVGKDKLEEKTKIISLSMSLQMKKSIVKPYNPYARELVKQPLVEAALS